MQSCSIGVWINPSQPAQLAAEAHEGESIRRMILEANSAKLPYCAEVVAAERKDPWDFAPSLA